MSAATVGRAVLQIVTEGVDGALKELDKLKGGASGFAGSFTATGKSLQKWGADVGELGKGLTGFVTGPIVGAIGSLTALAVTSAKTGDAIAKDAREAGLSAQAYQELKFALTQVADVSDEEVVKAFGKITGVIGEAASGSRTAIKALEQLGFTQQQIATGTISTEDAFTRLNAKLQQTATAAEASALTGDLVGDKLGMKLAGALRDAGGEVDALRGRFRDLGLGMSDESLAASEKFGDQLDELQQQFGALGREIGAAVLPMVTESLIPFLRDTGIPILKRVADAVAGAVRWFVDLPAPVQGVIAVVTGLAAALGPVLVAVGAVVSAIGAAMPVLATVGGALATLATGPIGIVVAAVAGLSALWYAFGDDISAVVSSVWATVKEFFVDTFGPMLKPVGELLTSIGQMFVAFGELVFAVVGKVIGTWIDFHKNAALYLWDKVKPVVEALSAGIRTIVAVFTVVKDAAIAQAKALFEGVWNWLVGKFQGLVDGVKSKIDAVTGFFKGLYDAVVGNSYIPDLVIEIGDWMGPRLEQALVGNARSATAAAGDAFKSLLDGITGRFASWSNSLGAWLQGHLPGVLGKGLGSVTSGLLGSFSSMLTGGISQLVNMGAELAFKGLQKIGGAIASAFGRNATKGSREDFAQSLGFTDDPKGIAGGNTALGKLNAYLASLGPEGDELRRIGSEVVGKNDKRGNELWMQQVQSFLERQNFDAFTARFGDLTGSAPQLAPALADVRAAVAPVIDRETAAGAAPGWIAAMREVLVDVVREHRPDYRGAHVDLNVAGKRIGSVLLEEVIHAIELNDGDGMQVGPNTRMRKALGVPAYGS